MNFQLMTIATLKEYIGRFTVTEDDMTGFPLSALAATLDRNETGETVPPLWHWLYFLPTAPQSVLGPD